jgi:hypothetical protein
MSECTADQKLQSLHSFLVETIRNNTTSSPQRPFGDKLPWVDDEVISEIRHNGLFGIFETFMFIRWWNAPKPTKMFRVSARRLSIYNFAWGLLKTSNLQAESKFLKKIIGTKSINQNKKFLKKNVFRTLKVERGQKYAWTELAGPTQYPKKIISTSNQPIRTKFFPKKVCLVH